MSSEPSELSEIDPEVAEDREKRREAIRKMIPEAGTRQHGFQKPFHPAQLTLWILLFISVTLTLSCISPVLTAFFPVVVQVVYYAVFLLLLGICLVALVIVTKTNPSDYYIRTGEEPNPFGNPSEKLDLEFCQECASWTNKNVKHCHYCNRCVHRFDHHCMWLNNCIAPGRNYYSFSSFIFSLMIISIWITVVSSLVFYFAITGAANNQINDVYYESNGTVQEVNGMRIFTIIVAFGTALIGLVGISFLIQLNIFHFYLALTKQTTWNLIVKKREKAASAQEYLQATEAEKENARSFASMRQGTNQVVIMNGRESIMNWSSPPSSKNQKKSIDSTEVELTPSPNIQAPSETDVELSISTPLPSSSESHLKKNNTAERPSTSVTTSKSGQRPPMLGGNVSSRPMTTLSPFNPNSALYSDSSIRPQTSIG